VPIVSRRKYGRPHHRRRQGVAPMVAAGLV